MNNSCWVFLDSQVGYFARIRVRLFPESPICGILPNTFVAA